MINIINKQMIKNKNKEEIETHKYSLHINSQLHEP